MIKRKRKRPKRGSYKGLSYSSSKELMFLEQTLVPPVKAKPIKTPLSFYTPDFEFSDRFIEIKSLGSFLVCLGLAKFNNKGKFSDLQWRKIKWVAINKKPVDIIVYLEKNEAIPIINIEEPNINIILKGGVYIKK